MASDLFWLVCYGVSFWLIGRSLFRLLPMVMGTLYLTSFLMKLGKSGLIDGRLLYWICLGAIWAFAIWGIARNGLPLVRLVRRTFTPVPPKKVI